jgi:hypothetical protein
MPWDAGGAFNRLYSWVSDAAAGYDILASRMDADTNDIVQGVQRCRNLDGYNHPSINLPMGGFKHTGVAAASTSDNYARWDQVVPAAGGAFTGAVTFTDITATTAHVGGVTGMDNTGIDTSNLTAGTAAYIANVTTINNTGIGTSNVTANGTAYLGSGAVTINASGIDANNLTVTGTSTEGTVNAGGGAVTLNTQGVTSNNLTVTGNASLGGGAVTINSSGISANNLTATVNATLQAAGIGGGAVEINNTGISANNLTVTGSVNAAGVTATGATINGPLNVGGATSLQGLDVGGATTFHAAISFPTGGGGLPINNGCVVNPDTGAAVGLQVNADIVAHAGGTGDGRVDAAGGYYVSGTPHMLTGTFGSLFRTLLDAPDGASFVIAKQGGEFTALPIGLAPADAYGRRGLFIEAV